MKNKKPFMIPKEYKQASLWKRFLASIIDFSLVFITGFLLFSLVAKPIFLSNSKYNNYVEDSQTSFNCCNNMFVDSKLSRINDDTFIDNQIIVDEIIDLYLTDTVNDNYPTYKDPVGFYYVNFAANNLTINDVSIALSIEDFNKNIYNITDVLTDQYWDLSTLGDFASIKQTHKVKISAYLDGDYTLENQISYDYFNALFTNALEMAQESLAGTDQYSALHSKGINSYLHSLLFFGVGSLICYFIGSFILFFMVPLAFKNGQTIAKYFLKLYVYDDNFKPVNKKKIILRFIASFLLYIPAALFIPFPDISLLVINMPLFFINSTPIDLISIAFPIVLVQIYSLLCFKNNHNMHINDVITQSIVLSEIPLQNCGDQWKKI